MIIGISFVLAPTSVCAAPTPGWPARAASRCTWAPAGWRAPRTGLPATPAGARGARGEQFQRVAATRCGAGGGQPRARQASGEPGYQPPARHEAATSNDTIEHGEAPAVEGLWEDTS